MITSKPFELFIQSPEGSEELQFVDAPLEDWNCEVRSIIRDSSNIRLTPIDAATPIQTGMWPAVTKLDNVLAVDSKLKGKTIGWVIPLMNQLIHSDQYQDLPIGGSPRCVVVVPDHKTAQDIEDVLEDIISEANLAISINRLHMAVEHEAAVVSLLNGCDVLIATPPALSRFLIEYDQYTNGTQTINFTRACHLVIEEAHITLSLFPDEMISIMQEFRHPHHGSKPLLPYKIEPRNIQQLIVVARFWNTSLQDFKNVFFQGHVMFGDTQEAAVYNKFKFIAQLSSSPQQKIDQLMKIAKENSSKKLFICCKDSDSGTRVKNILFARGINPVFIHEQSSQEELPRLVRTERRNLFVITDNLMQVLLPEDKACLKGDYLVHWDLPDTDPRLFRLRFALIKEAEAKKAEVHLLISKQDKRQMKDVKYLLDRTHAQISEPLQDFIQQTLQEKEVAKKEYPLCSTLVSLGECRDEKVDCPHRHKLTKSDTDEKKVNTKEHKEDEKSRDTVVEEIRFQVLRSVSPVMFWIRIQTPKTDDQYAFLISLAAYFFEEENRELLSEDKIKVGERCVAMYYMGDLPYFFRAVINHVSVRQRGFREVIERIEVHGIDTGELRTVPSSQIFHLPVQYSHLQVEPMAVMAVVAGLHPQDKDTEWDFKTSTEIDTKLRILLCVDQANFSVCRARVIQRTKDIVWLDKFGLWEKKTGIGKYTCKFDLASYLTHQGKKAVRNSGHYLRIQRMVEKAGIPVSRLLLEKFKSANHKNKHSVMSEADAVNPDKAAVTEEHSSCLKEDKAETKDTPVNKEANDANGNASLRGDSDDTDNEADPPDFNFDEMDVKFDENWFTPEFCQEALSCLDLDQMSNVLQIQDASEATAEIEEDNKTRSQVQNFESETRLKENKTKRSNTVVYYESDDSDSFTDAEEEIQQDRGYIFEKAYPEEGFDTDEEDENKEASYIRENAVRDHTKDNSSASWKF